MAAIAARSYLLKVSGPWLPRTMKR